MSTYDFSKPICYNIDLHVIADAVLVLHQHLEPLQRQQPRGRVGEGGGLQATLMPLSEES